MHRLLPKNLFLIFALIFIIIVALLTLVFNLDLQKDIPSKSEIETAINQAKYLYNLRKQEGINLSNGPCLTNALMPNWVVDIVHKPRQDIDDLPENQCAAFREGRAKHFVELDFDGNLVRAE